MNEDLYFVPIICEALQEQDAPAALGRAFKKIEDLGRDPAYQHGHRQFIQFMETVRSQAQGQEAEAPEFAQELLTALASITSDEDLRKHLTMLAERYPTERQQLSALLVRIDEAYKRTGLPSVLLDLQDEVAAAFRFDEATRVASARNVRPGQYELKLDTGRVLWAGALTERDLLWSAAFPGQPFELAADSGQVPSQPTRQIELLDGALVMRIYAGLEGGVVELEHVEHGV